MPKGFTLLELIIVLIIVGILVSLAFPLYTQILEKFRAAEAKTILGVLRKAQAMYYLEYEKYGHCVDLSNNIPCTRGYYCNDSNFYYQYFCELATDRCLAFRCTSGGKSPDAQSEYVIFLGIDGVWDVDPPSYRYLIK